MPAWAVRVGLKLAQDPQKGIKWFFAIILAILAFIMILAAPFMILFMPFVEDDQKTFYIEAASQMAAETQVFVDYREILAVDTVVREQDFDGVTKKKIYDNYRDKFIWEEKVEITVPCGDSKNPNKVCTSTVTYYHVRSINEVMDILGFDEEQREMAMNYLQMMYEEDGGIGGGVVIGGGGKLSPEVLRYQDLVYQEAVKNGIQDYVKYILAMIQQESGGRLLDVMQASESLGLPRNSITDPVYSIQVGVSKFAERLRDSKFDIKLALQSYNFGPGFIDYANERGGYSKEVAIAFSNMWAQIKGWPRYGDINYVDSVLQYVTDSNQRFDFDQVLAIMRSFSNLPYVWGGRNPSDGGFDCSGLIEYALGKVGVNLVGTAATQYTKTVPINESEAQPGDLVFFNTQDPRDPDYDPSKVTHVGMYMGNGKFFNAQNSGIKEANLNFWRSEYIFLGFRHIP